MLVCERRGRCLDEKDGLVRQHDLVVVLHCVESALDVRLGELGRVVLAHVAQNGVQHQRLSSLAVKQLEEQTLEVFQSTTQTQFIN